MQNLLTSAWRGVMKRFFKNTCSLRGVATEISMIVEDTQVSTLEQIYFHTCWVRCLQFLPALSLFVLLLSVNMSRDRAEIKPCLRASASPSAVC